MTDSLATSVIGCKVTLFTVYSLNWNVTVAVVAPDIGRKIFVK